MSIVAEFARLIHEKDTQDNNRVLTPISYPSQTAKLYDIKAVIFDIYGTLVNYWCTDFLINEQKERALLTAFRKTSDFFAFTDFLEEMNPEDIPERTLRDLYHGLIALNHEKSLKKGVSFPEVRIKEIWEVILMMLERHGYNASKPDLGERKDLARCIAFYYNFHSLGRGFYDGVVDALSTLKKITLSLVLYLMHSFTLPLT